MNVSKLGVATVPLFAFMVGTSYAGIVPSQSIVAYAPTVASEGVLLAANDRDTNRERRSSNNSDRRDRRSNNNDDRRDRRSDTPEPLPIN